MRQCFAALPLFFKKKKEYKEYKIKENIMAATKSETLTIRVSPEDKEKIKELAEA